LININYINNNCYRKGEIPTFCIAFGNFVTGKCFLDNRNTKYIFIYKNIGYRDSSRNMIYAQTTILFQGYCSAVNSKEKEKFEYLYKQNRDNQID